LKVVEWLRTIIHCISPAVSVIAQRL
jgi:hypothetical protein